MQGIATVHSSATSDAVVQQSSASSNCRCSITGWFTLVQHFFFVMAIDDAYLPCLLRQMQYQYGSPYLWQGPTNDRQLRRIVGVLESAAVALLDSLRCGQVARSLSGEPKILLQHVAASVLLPLQEDWIVSVGARTKIAGTYRSQHGQDQREQTLRQLLSHHQLRMIVIAP